MPKGLSRGGWMFYEHLSHHLRTSKKKTVWFFPRATFKLGLAQRGEIIVKLVGLIGTVQPHLEHS
jgi:hypothetical protein